MYNGVFIMINYNLHTNRDKQGLGHRVYLAGDLHSKVSVRAGGRVGGREGGRGGEAHPAGPACPHSNRFLQGCNSLCQLGANIFRVLQKGRL